MKILRRIVIFVTLLERRTELAVDTFMEEVPVGTWTSHPKLTVSEDVRSAVDDLEDSIPILGGVTIINVEPIGTTRAELDEAVRVWNKAAQSLGCDGVGWSAGRLKLPDSS